MFIDADDRLDFLRRLAVTGKRFAWVCRAFCLMTTHYHLLVEAGDDRLQPGMHRLNGQYAQQFNRKYGRKGHLRGDRYTPTPVETESHLIAAFRYIVRNPVRAGLTQSPSEWPWSSYRGTAGLDGRFAFVRDEPIRAYFGGETEEALRRLRDFCEVS
jgi:REP element-mobilizing transposase RayT